MPTAEEDKIALCANLKFLRESLEDARDKPEERVAALCEAEGSVPLIRKGLKADGTFWAQATLIADEEITSKNWRDWWKKLVKKDERQLISDIEHLLKVLDPLKTVISCSEGR